MQNFNTRQGKVSEISLFLGEGCSPLISRLPGRTRPPVPLLSTPTNIDLGAKEEEKTVPTPHATNY